VIIEKPKKELIPYPPMPESLVKIDFKPLHGLKTFK
jgi:hypothetical protein